MYDDLLLENKKLRTEVERLWEEVATLRADAGKLVSQAVKDADKLSRRTLHMALMGVLPKPGTPEHAALGYKSEGNEHG
jgi:hypothetical protein